MSVAPGMSRRTLLAGLLLVVPAVAGCTAGAAGADDPDPLIELAATARADAALAAAVIAAVPALTDRVEPLRMARTEHAAALDAEIARLAKDPTTAPPVPPATPTPAPPAPTQVRLRETMTASAAAATAAALDLPAARVGLVASVAACCATYAAVLG